MKSLVINFLGDSITEGAGALCSENAFPAVCCRLAKAKEGNYGLGGTRIAKQRVSINNNPDENSFSVQDGWVHVTFYSYLAERMTLDMVMRN